MALDGMFKREDENRVARQRVAQRVGRLVGVSKLEQGLLNRLLPPSCAVRNDVVHGRPDYTDADVDDAITGAEDILRRSLVALATRQQPVDLTA